MILNESHKVLAGARKTTNRNTPQDNAKCYKCVDNRKGKQRVGVWKVKNKSRGGVIAQHTMNQQVNIPNTQQTSQQTIYVGMQWYKIKGLVELVCCFVLWPVMHVCSCFRLPVVFLSHLS